MRQLALCIGLCFASGTPAIAADATIKPFHAEYDTQRNGEPLGRTTLELRDDGDGSWTLRSETNGTSGLAKMAGVHVVETSRFRWKGGKPEALSYDYKQDTAFKNRVRHADFDWTANQVHVIEGKDEFRYATTPGLIDRQAVTLAVAADLMRGGASAYNYNVAVKDRVDEMRYTRAAPQSLSVPAGTFNAVEMQTSADDDRSRTCWFAESLGWLPVQIEQTEKKGDTITLKLVSSNRK
jgi:Protein of unknown function (DUF3108)